MSNNKNKNNDSNEINKLVKEKNFDEIYRRYGRHVYLNYVTCSYINNDIKNLINDGRYYEIYEKYDVKSYSKYSKYLDFLRNNEKNIELGISKIKKYNFVKYFVRKLIIKTSIRLLLIVASINVMLPISTNNLIKKNGIMYSEEIDKYNHKNKDYSDKINEMKLSDLEVIMKVTDDLWSNCKGYGQPKKNIMGYYRLDFLEKNGVGICRNMADDITAKLDAINSKYNARNLIVYADYNNLKTANIERKYSEKENTIIEEGNLFDATKIFGNHMVTLIDIPEENITLVVDSTNSSIGVYIDGNIYIFNDDCNESLKTKWFGELAFGSKMFFEYIESYTNSYLNPTSSLEDINNKYGLKAQNIALYNVRNYDELNKTVNTNNNILMIKKLEVLKMEILQYQSLDLVDIELIKTLK